MKTDGYVLVSSSHVFFDDDGYVLVSFHVGSLSLDFLIP